MENEIMNYEDVMDTEVEVIEMENEDSGVGAGKVALICAGVALAGTAVVTLGKKLYAKYKAHKEMRKPEEGQAEEITYEQIEEVAAK